MKNIYAISLGILFSSAIISLSFSAYGYYFETLSGVDPLHRILLFPIFIGAGIISAIICCSLARMFRFRKLSKESSFFIGWICGLSSLGLILDGLIKWAPFFAPALAISAALLYWYFSKSVETS